MSVMDGKLIFSHEGISLYYIYMADLYKIVVPTRRWITVPKENIEDMQRILAAAKDHRDFGTIEEDY